jgi:hypothetical protein
MLLLVQGCIDTINFGDDYTYNFIDKDLEGVIDTDYWAYQTGVAHKAFFNDDELRVELYPQVIAEPCGFHNDYRNDYVTFDIPRETGVYELEFSLFGTSQTVDFYNQEMGISFSASKGAIEILSVDEENNLLTGRIDAYVDDETNINGNFEVVICD